jgi:hypothetical protein
MQNINAFVFYAHLTLITLLALTVLLARQP